MTQTDTLVPVRPAPAAPVAGERIDIAMGFDSNYAAHAAVVVSSIARRARIERLHFLMVHDNVSRALQAEVESVAPGATFRWVQVRDEDVPAYAARGHLNRTVLFRLLLDRLAEETCRRIIYIDSDVVVLRDIGELWASDLGEAPIGAVTDAYCDPAAFAETWSLAKDDLRYFNAGVLLIDLDKVRAENAFAAALKFIVEHDEKLLLGDQDALNAIFWGRWKRLDKDWNVQRFARGAAGRDLCSARGPALVHFITQYKPWTPKTWHPWSWMYWIILARTPFRADVIARYKMTPLRRAWLWLKWMRDRPRVRGFEV